LPFSFVDDIPWALWEDLIEFGGFPEIFYARDTRDMRRWHRDRTQRLIQEDIRDLSTVRDLARIDLLVTLLPDRIGSIFSLNSMIEDIQVTHKTLTHWMEILEQIYFCYRIYPYQSTQIRSLKKEPKIYLWDYTGMDDIGIRNENIVANHLLKYVHFLVDVYWLDAELYFLRDREQREVDFCIEIDGVIQCIIEVKSKKQSVSPHLRYFYEKLGKPPAYQLVFDRWVDEDHDGIRVMSADRFLSGLV
jgi:predicted AAA+ superfamily ATPase